MREKEKEECKQKCYIATSEAEIEIQGYRGSRDGPKFSFWNMESLFVLLHVAALLSAVQARLLGRRLLPKALTTKLL